LNFTKIVHEISSQPSLQPGISKLIVEMQRLSHWLSNCCHWTTIGISV